MKWGATEIAIYVVWIHDHDRIYDAEVARVLHILVRPAYVRNEVLLLGGVVDRASPRVLDDLDYYGVSPKPYLCDHLLSLDGRLELGEVDFWLEASNGVYSDRKFLRARLPIGGVSFSQFVES